jgi:glycosyltransferase involved in cell wall biosynthesis
MTGPGERAIASETVGESAERRHPDKRPVNIAIFTDTDFGKVNGVTTSLKAALRYAPEGIHPRIYTACAEAEGGADYFAVRSVGMAIPFCGEMTMYWPRAMRLLREARQDRIDVVHLATPGPVGLAAMYVARRAGLPMIGSFHTDLAAYAERLSGSPRLGVVMREYLRWPYGRCARVLVPSESTRAVLVKGKVRADTIDVWPRGVDTQTFGPAHRSVSLRERWGVSGARPAVIYVGRMSKEKGLHLLPRIEAALLRHGVDHRLILVGDGPMREPLAASLRDAVFTGTLPPAGVAEAMASADLFLFPSDTDAAGNVVLEAQACGLPVVVSSRGGPREYIRPDDTGVVCPAGDAERFGHVAAMLLRTPQRRRAMGEAARAHALTLRWESALAPLYRTYLEVAGRSRLDVAAAPDNAAA